MGASTPLATRDDRPAQRAPEYVEQRPNEPAAVVPLTAALLDVALHGVSFATPGHRGGRSWQVTPTR